MVRRSRDFPTAKSWHCNTANCNSVLQFLRIQTVTRNFSVIRAINTKQVENIWFCFVTNNKETHNLLLLIISLSLPNETSYSYCASVIVTTGSACIVSHYADFSYAFEWLIHACALRKTNCCLMSFQHCNNDPPSVFMHVFLR